MREIHRLTEDEVLLVRRRMATYADLAQKAFGQIEPLNRDKLGSAVFRQHTGSGKEYKYKTIPDVGANLFYGVAMSHAFENGNKRTALVSLLVFLDKNKTQLINANDDDLYELARSMAAHQIAIRPGTNRNVDSEVEAVGDWLRRHTREIVLGDSQVDFKPLRELLESQGCTLEKPEGNYIKIRRGGLSVRTGFHRPNFRVPVGEVKRIRKFLGLDEHHGVDSAGFYSLEHTVDDAVATYRNLMSR
jgi:death-on-curing family protein